ncbi:dihydrolipoyllysine-residue succinyltransferase [secondary endosymbiont of Ctenarytaina eucalypti]|uniref:Dihydrolipoyllysine-residue succinyltransferase n=1 Tax=secondary endosymbiont of Ctenarytaina eucalypti TaxID=1199245 RepID=J3YR48_9ENTR|nr:dihydrolipoyllysine-residue succinyltransferase [secondary endosymbiont of Ctenarytaina eucalypti]AFP84473.1 2-oxoglutarate dehydrogenase complex dihydrolipoamide succinyltransferase [secondary endosymbiont of Ctenarytaina eucalypti]
MSNVDILVPDLLESISDATVVNWNKTPGEPVQRDEVLVELETDKVVLEVLSPEAGILEEVLEDAGSTVTSRQVLGRLRRRDSTGQAQTEQLYTQKTAMVQGHQKILEAASHDTSCLTISQLIADHDLNAEVIKNSGINDDLTHEDVEKEVVREQSAPAPIGNRREKRVPMTRLRHRVSQRLVEAKNSTAMLTTFNEVNMQPVMALRQQYGEAFEKRHGIRLGYMSFYIKAVLEALKRFPEVNASIDGEDVVYRHYFDISIAVSTPRGLVTPVLKDIDMLGMAGIEKKIKQFALKGRNGTLTVEELTGGSFTVTNGGTFGSLISTPIINPPQSAILGMHVIKDRPMAVGGKVVILPMMYLALSYDHRLIDGKESISFLVTVKDVLEDPIRLLLDV